MDHVISDSTRHLLLSMNAFLASAFTDLEPVLN